MTFENKKKYELPTLEYIEIGKLDIIRTSDGFDTPIENDPFGDWEI